MSKPKPIHDDPTQGQYQVVASFRLKPHRNVGLEDAREGVIDLLVNDYDETDGLITDLDVAVREIGAGGESSEIEGEGP